MEALLRENDAKGKLFLCLSGEESEEVPCRENL
jgi:hypothetical protein